MKIASSFSHEDVRVFKFGSWPFGKPRLFSHIFFVDGLLIDTGHSKMREAVRSAVASLPIDQLFITHHHEDHTGNLSVLHPSLSCPAYASPKCIELMKMPPPISFAQWLTWGSRPAYTGLEETMDRLSTPHHTFEVFPIPGHAVDMLALYEREKGWLFSADLWVSERIRYFMRAESMHEQIQSIKRMLKLDFEVLFCSHNPQLSEGKQKLAKKLQFLEDFYGKAATLYQAGYSAAGILQGMGLKEKWSIRLMSTGELSTINMVKAVIRDEQERGLS